VNGQAETRYIWEYCPHDQGPTYGGGNHR
jgi:hypothetical protein